MSDKNNMSKKISDKWSDFKEYIKKLNIFNKIIFCLIIAVVIYIGLVFLAVSLSEICGLSDVIFNGTFALGILAGIPTIYLWSLKEENKQRELSHIGVPSAYEKFVSIRNRFKNFAVILYI